MKTKSLICGMTALLSLGLAPIQAQQYDPPCVVEQWSNASTYDKVIDINFSDADMPDTWPGGTGIACPSYSEGGYYNGILEVPLYEGGEKSEYTYPLLFHNCTFANYYLFDAITSAIITIGYVLPDEQIYDNPLMEAVFNNCIIYGNTSDISHGDLAGSNVKLQHCLLRSKGEDDNNFIACTWGGDPKFYTVREEYVFDYRLKDESDAIGKGNTALCPENARYDRFGNDRMQASGLDLGAYVYIPEPKEEQQ